MEHNTPEMGTTVSAQTAPQTSSSSRKRSPPPENHHQRKTKILAIDPGIKNLVSAVFEFTEDDAKLLEWNSYDTTTTPLAECVKMMHLAFAKYPCDVAVIEYQPPIPKQKSGFSMSNVFIEGGVTVGLEVLGCKLQRVHPYAAKKKFSLSTGDYTKNKKAALDFASGKCFGIPNHHVADCFVLANYYFSVI